MSWLAVVAVIGSAALAGIVYGGMLYMDVTENENCRARINRIADQSRKKGRFFADGPMQNDNRRARRYSRAGVSL